MHAHISVYESNSMHLSGNTTLFEKSFCKTEAHVNYLSI